MLKVSISCIVTWYFYSETSQARGFDEFTYFDSLEYEKKYFHAACTYSNLNRCVNVCICAFLAAPELLLTLLAPKSRAG
jgi:hypothetical protein